MERIAFIIGETFIYWHSIILTLAAVTAVFLFLGFYLGRGGSWYAGFAAVPIAFLLSLICSRFMHWYCMTASYPSFQAAMTDYSTGSFALMGVFAGCVLTACLLRLLRLHKNLPQMLDCMALAGAGGIVIGRLSCLYNSSDRGMLMNSITKLPLAYPVVDPVTGETTYRLATFMLQAIVTGIIFLVLLVLYFRTLKKRKNFRDGDIAMIFLILHCACQEVLDSTRYDSLFFRSNGFVSIVMVLCAVGMVVPVVIYSVRMVKARGWNPLFLLFWIGIAALLGGAGYMEYYVQRHGNAALFSYSVMSSCLIAVVALALSIRKLSFARGGKFLRSKKLPKDAPAVPARQPARSRKQSARPHQQAGR